jgi:rhamnosyltransferase
MYRVAAYITAYNDLDAVQKCITAIQCQTYPVEKIYIIDNSKEPINSMIEDHQGLIFDHHPENIGVAQGLNIGMAWAIQENYDFLWTFDQDSEPNTEALALLISAYSTLLQSKVDVGILACLPIDQRTEFQLHGLIFDKYKFTMIDQSYLNDDYYECDIVITSGSLMVIDALKNIPIINSLLFIDAVDWDLCLKLRSAGYKIYIHQKSILKHCYGNSHQIDIPFLKKTIIINCYSPLRYYYISRNQTFITTRYVPSSSSLLLTILYYILSLLKKSIKILLFDRHELFTKLYAVTLGTIHGFLGNLENPWR